MEFVCFLGVTKIHLAIVEIDQNISSTTFDLCLITTIQLPGKLIHLFHSSGIKKRNSSQYYLLSALVAVSGNTGEVDYFVSCPCLFKFIGLHPKLYNLKPHLSNFPAGGLIPLREYWGSPML